MVYRSNGKKGGYSYGGHPSATSPATGNLQLSFAPAADQPIVTSGAGSPVFTNQTVHTPKRIGDNTTAVDVAGDPKFRYPGIPPGTLGPAAINSRIQSPLMPGGAAQARRWDAQIEFLTSSKYVGLDWVPAAASTTILVVVNGKWTGPAFAVSAMAGSVSFVLLEFPDNRPRTVKLILGAHQIRTIGTETAYPPVRSTSAGKTLLTIGDSLSAGSGTATFLDVWPQATATILGFDHCCNAAIGGTKWVPSGSGDVAISHFGGDRLPLALTTNPEAVVFAGSRNDSGSNQAELDAITTAVLAVIDATGGSKRFMMGTFTVLPQSGAVKAAAAARGVAYIDMQYGLLAADLAGGDGVHPPYAGAVNLRDRIVPQLKIAGCVP